MRQSGAQAIIQGLLEHGVDTVFGYPGGAILPLYDALYDAPLRHILTVHEQGASHAADGYARASGKVGVCIATSGPGATNLVTGLANAYLDSVPVVAITGQVATPLMGRDSFQEVDITGITMPVTKHNFLVKDVRRIPEFMRLAFKIACAGRPGPVLIDVPRDIQLAEFDLAPAALPEAPEPYRLSPAVLAQVKAAAAAIRSAARPVILAGGGAVAGNAGKAVLELAAKNDLPIVCSLMGLGAFASDEVRLLGLTGMHGGRTANRVVYAADLIIAVGSRFNDRTTGDRLRYADGKVIVHLDVDPAEIEKNIASVIGLAGEVNCLLTLLTDAAEQRERDDWWRQIREWRQWEDNSPLPTENEALTPRLAMEIIGRAAGKDVIYTTDVGQHQMWAALFLNRKAPRSWLTSGGLGTMGFGLPAAIGAQTALPSKRVVHISGDGSFRMTGNELYTVALYRLPIISVIINNGTLGMVRQWQTLFFRERYSASTLPGVMDFCVYARAFGIDAAEPATVAEFEASFTEALSRNEPKVIVLNISEDEMVTQMVPPGATLDRNIDLGPDN